MKDDTSTPTPEDGSPNEFERNKPQTNARGAAEAAIEDLRQRGGVFVEAVAATRMPMVLTDPTLPGNPIVFANKAFLRLSGYRMEEVLGQQPHFMNGPDTDKRDAAGFAEAIRADQDDIIETVQYRENGSRFIATVLISAFKDEDGRVLNHFMSWLDVTRRVEAEDEIADLKAARSQLRASDAALRESERLRDSALLAAEIGTWNYDLVADVCHFDARAQKMYNLPSEQLDHRRAGVAMVVHPDDVEPMFDEIQRATDVNGEGRYDITYRIAQADGKYHWLRACGITEFEGTGDNRRAIRITGASRDITLEREAEATLRESERLRSAMMDVLPLALALTDRDGNAIMTNAEWKRFVPTARIPSRDQERQPRWRSWDDDGRLIEPMDFPGARALRGEHVDPPMELLFADEDGSEIWTSVGAVPLRDSHDEVVGAVCFIQNIDAVKRSNDALAASERHAQILLAELQHRVRNTLAVVRSMARRTAENCESAEDMLAHFQGRLDAFSRVQAALTRNADARVELKSLIEDELVAHAARDGDQVEIKGPEVLLDARSAERLSLAIHELATNAVKHGALTNERGRIKVSWDTKEAEGVEQLSLRWIESEVAIEPNGSKREGFGMELLLRALPDDLRGETKVELTPGGLRFELRMPLAAAGTP